MADWNDIVIFSTSKITRSDGAGEKFSRGQRARTHVVRREMNLRWLRPYCGRVRRWPLAGTLSPWVVNKMSQFTKQTKNQTITYKITAVTVYGRQLYQHTRHFYPFAHLHNHCLCSIFISGVENKSFDSLSANHRPRIDKPLINK